MKIEDINDRLLKLRFEEKYGEAHTIELKLIRVAKAAADVQAQNCGMPKSCGHPYYCVCPGDELKAALAELEAL